MSGYQDYLASRGYVRATVKTTDKKAGDIVLRSSNKPVERIPTTPNVVAIVRRKGKG